MCMLIIYTQYILIFERHKSKKKMKMLANTHLPWVISLRAPWSSWTSWKMKSNDTIIFMDHPTLLPEIKNHTSQKANFASLIYHLNCCLYCIHNYSSFPHIYKFTRPFSFTSRNFRCLHIGQSIIEPEIEPNPLKDQKLQKS